RRLPQLHGLGFDGGEQPAVVGVPLEQLEQLARRRGVPEFFGAVGDAEVVDRGLAAAVHGDRQPLAVGAERHLGDEFRRQGDPAALRPGVGRVEDDKRLARLFVLVVVGRGQQRRGRRKGGGAGERLLVLRRRVLKRAGRR